MSVDGEMVSKERSEIPVSLIRSGFHTFGTNILMIILGLVSNIIIARMLGPENKGNYDLVLATV